MKTLKLLGSVVILSGILLSACAAVPSGKAMSNLDSLSVAALSQAVTSTPQASFTQAPVFFDDKSTETTGTVEAITDTSITIDGQTYAFAPGAEIKGTIVAGAPVKLHLITNADGSLSVREIELIDPTQITHTGVDDSSNSTSMNDDNASNHDINDDKSNDSLSEDHHSNDNQGNDDHGSGGHSSDDHSSSGHG